MGIRYRDYYDNMSRDEQKAYCRMLFGPPYEILRGKERDEVEFLLALLEPTDVINNQTTVTEVYEQNGARYHVVYTSMATPPTIVKYPSEK